MTNNNVDKELNLDDLENISGGMGDAGRGTASASNGTDENHDVIAFCKQCGKLLNYLGQKRIGGGNTGIYKCTNPLCSQFDKEKNNLEVKFTR